MKAYYLGMSLLWCLSGGISAAADADGAGIARTCATCHDMERGERNAVPPSLKGRKAAYLVAALQAFKHGKREATIMDRIATGYSTAEIRAVARYIATINRSNTHRK